MRWKREHGGVAGLLLCGMATACGPPSTAAVDGGAPAVDAGPRESIDSGRPDAEAAVPVDGGRVDSGSPDSGRPVVVEMGMHVHGGFGTLGGSPSAGRYRIVDDHMEYGGMSCGGRFCVFGGTATGHGLAGAE